LERQSAVSEDYSADGEEIGALEPSSRSLTKKRCARRCFQRTLQQVVAGVKDKEERKRLEEPRG
jgi:hypothetical protein